MPTLDEVFDTMDYPGAVNDVIVIDPEKKTFDTPATETLLGAYQDRDTERKYFKIRRYVGDNIDLSLCDAYVNYVSVGGMNDTYPVKDLKADETDVTFSWLLSGNVFDENKDGQVFFSVLFKTKDGQKAFSTTVAEGKTLKSIESVTTDIEHKYPDLIEDILRRIETLEQGGGTGGGGLTPEQAQQIEQNKNDITNLKGRKVVTKVSELENDSKYQTDTQVEQTITNKGYQTSSQVQQSINSAIKNITSFSYEKVGQLPESGKKGIIYLVPTKQQSTQDMYDEYIWIDTAFEFIGTTRIDLSQYAKKTDLPKNVSDLTNDSKFQTKAEVEQAIENATPKPTKLQPLTFTGAVQKEYDGTEPITVDIPSVGETPSGGLKLLYDDTFDVIQAVSKIEKDLLISCEGMEYFIIFFDATANQAENTTNMNDNFSLRVGNGQINYGRLGDPRGPLSCIAEIKALSNSKLDSLFNITQFANSSAFNISNVKSGFSSGDSNKNYYTRFSLTTFNRVGYKGKITMKIYGE